MFSTNQREMRMSKIQPAGKCTKKSITEKHKEKRNKIFEVETSRKKNK